MPKFDILGNHIPRYEGEAKDLDLKTIRHEVVMVLPGGYSLPFTPTEEEWREMQERERRDSE